MFPRYTKTFGGKIWKKLHSVSPGNFFDKWIKGYPLEFFPPKTIQHIPSWTQTNEKILYRVFQKVKDFEFGISIFVFKMVYFILSC